MGSYLCILWKIPVLGIIALGLFLSTYHKLTDLIYLLKFLVNVNAVYLYSLLVNPYRRPMADF